MLTDTIFPSEFESEINRYLGIDSNGLPILDSNGNVVQSYGDYPSLFAKAYNDYALSGEVKSAVHGSEQPSILESWLKTYHYTVAEFAQLLADYWFTVLLIPGPPTHGGVTVTNIVNDATSHVSDFESAILSSISHNGIIYRPVFIELIDNVQSIALPTITWYITEQFSDGSSQTFPENIS